MQTGRLKKHKLCDRTLIRLGDLLRLITPQE
jgi:hypothetical protein